MEAVILLLASLLLLSLLIVPKKEGFEPYPYTQGKLLDNAYNGMTSLLRLNFISPFWRFYEGNHKFPLSPKHITYPKNYVYYIRGQDNRKVHLGGCQQQVTNVPY